MGVKLRKFRQADVDVLQLGSQDSSKQQSAATNSLYFQLSEYDAFRAGSFNVLYVQTPRNPVLEAPLVRALITTVHETGDLLKPIMRFGLPQTSLQDKCAYWRDTRTAVRSTPSSQLHKVLKALERPPHHLDSQQTHAQAHAQTQDSNAHAHASSAGVTVPVVASDATTERLATDSKQHQGSISTFSTGQAVSLVQLSKEQHTPLDHVHIPPSRFLYENIRVEAWMVAVLNVTAWAYLCTASSRF